MQVNKIKLINYRNYNQIEIQLGPKVNIFLGNNAQGKTNLLEAIYLAALTRSFRGTKDKDLIYAGRQAAYVGVDFETEDSGYQTVEFKLSKETTKRCKINGLEAGKSSEAIGLLNVVIFSPEDLKMIKEGPGERRRFLDAEISQIRPVYRRDLVEYTKLLKNRNIYLKAIRYQGSDMKFLDVLDEQLAEKGAAIIKSRILFIEDISKISYEIHKRISGEMEHLSLKYQSTLSLTENIEADFLEKLKANRVEDLSRLTTSVGPHRDDLEIYINDMDSKVYASQGQQRSAALSIKLAEVELIKKYRGEYPVVLLDDVMSELDEERRRLLITTFKDIQTIITTTDDVALMAHDNIQKQLFFIESGNIKE